MPLDIEFFVANWWIIAIFTGALILAALWFILHLLRRNKSLKRRLMRRNKVDAALAPQLSAVQHPVKEKAVTMQLSGPAPKPMQAPLPVSEQQVQIPPVKKETTIQILNKPAPQSMPDAPVNNDTAAPKSRQIRVRYKTGAFMHIGTRKTQQDALYVSNPLHAPVVDGEPVLLGVLCDGMGGMENGEAASKLAVDTIAASFSAEFDAGDIPAFLERAAHTADNLINDTLSNGTDGGAGTTIVAVILIRDKLFWLSVGDSRIYILRNHEIVQVTRDHNFRLLLNEKVEAGELSQQDVEKNKDREALISYLGMGGIELLDINAHHFQLQRGDIILLCSDGLTKSLSNAQIQLFIQENQANPQDCARVLANKAMECRKDTHQDNTSVIVIRYTA